MMEGLLSKARYSNCTSTYVYPSYYAEISNPLQKTWGVRLLGTVVQWRQTTEKDKARTVQHASWSARMLNFQKRKEGCCLELNDTPYYTHNMTKNRFFCKRYGGKNTKKAENWKIKVKLWPARTYIFKKRKIGCWSASIGAPWYEWSVFQI